MRRFSRFFMFIACVCLLATSVFAQTGATSVSTIVTVSATGQASVTMNASIHLDTPSSALTFPLPAGAENVTMNGQSIRTYPHAHDKNVVVADLSMLDGATGDYHIVFSYTLPDVLRIEERELSGGKTYALVMEVPLLCGFEYPVEHLEFSITMPGDVTGVKPAFTSGVMQTSIESIISCTAENQLIAGTVTRQLQDRETVSLLMDVSEDMFPGKLIIPREGNPEIVPMAICAVLALIYWIVFMRTLPVFRHRRIIPMEGITAGELGSHLTAAGADLTMMVLTWAQLGYIRIHLDKYGRIFLDKRMDMGNERTDFECRTFRALFLRSATTEATGVRYANLCRQVSEHVPGIQEMYTKRSGNVAIFRLLCCGVSIFCGICYGMNLVATGWLRTAAVILCAILGIITAWAIQDGMYKVHIRGKIPVYVASVCGLVWMILGVVSGVWLFGVGTVAFQYLAGLASAYGGRRSELGRYNANEILGLRHYLKHVSQEELDRLVGQNPDYFFDMLPHAIALGVDTPFGKAFGDRKIPECTYLVMRSNEKRTAREWAYMVRKLADRMDSRQRRMELEQWIPLSLSGDSGVRPDDRRREPSRRPANRSGSRPANPYRPAAKRPAANRRPAPNRNRRG